MTVKREQPDAMTEKRVVAVANLMQPYLVKLRERVKDPLPPDAKEEVKAHRQRQIKFLEKSNEELAQDLAKHLAELNTLLGKPTP